MKPNKFEINQKVEIYGLPEVPGAQSSYNGSIGIILAYPGYHTVATEAYGVLLSNGAIVPCIPKFLRPFPPVLPNGRGDLDTKTTWADFDKATTLTSANFRFEPTASPDY